MTSMMQATLATVMYVQFCALQLLLRTRCSTAIHVVDINPNTQWSDDVDLSLGSATTVEDMRYYDVMVGSQSGSPDLGYDLQLELNHDIAFDCSTVSSSTLSLTLDGTTVNPAMTNDAYLLLIFAVADREFFAFVAYIGALSNIQSKVYPDDVLAQKTSVASWIEEPEFSRSRIEHATDGAQWTNLDLLQSWNSAPNSQWPLRFEVVNDVGRNISTVRLYHNDSATAMSSHSFADAFECDEDISIYVMGGYMGSSRTLFHYQLSNLRLTLAAGASQSSSSSSSEHTHIEETASKLTAVPTRPQLVNMNVLKPDNGTQQSDVAHTTHLNGDGDTRTIEPWFIVILISSVVLFCAARIVMKIPTDKWCRDTLVADTDDEDDGMGHESHDMDIGIVDLDTEAGGAKQKQHAENAKKVYNRVNSMGDEYDTNKNCSSVASTATASSSSYHTSLSSSSSLMSSTKRRYQPRYAFGSEMDDNNKLMAASSQSSPSLSSSVSTHNHMYTHLQAQRSLDTMDTISEPISEHGLSSVLRDVEKTRHLEVIPEDSNNDWEESRSMVDQSAETNVHSALKQREDSFSTHAIYDEFCEQQKEKKVQNGHDAKYIYLTK